MGAVAGNRLQDMSKQGWLVDKRRITIRDGDEALSVIRNQDRVLGGGGVNQVPTKTDTYGFTERT